VVAHHEIGHALVAAALQTTDRVHKVSIIPRGISALGYTIQRPIEDRYLMMRDELCDRMAVLLGGRAAEELIFERVSTGASDDLSKATDIARGMAMRYGMVPELGRGIWDSEPRPSPDGVWSRNEFSEETSRAIDQAVKQLLDEAHQRAHEVLDSHRDVLIDSARSLLEEETLDEEQLKVFFARLHAAPDA
jgi:cell division protease FtsH